MFLIAFLRTCITKRSLVYGFIKRDFYSRFAGSFLGMAWSYLIPAVQVLIYFFIFGVVLQNRAGALVSAEKISYTNWLLAGMVPWFFFSEVVLFGSQTLVKNASLIKKTLFPTEILTVSVSGNALFNHFVILILVIGLFLSNGIYSGIQLMYLIPLIFCLALISAGFSYILSVATLAFRDLTFVIPVLLNLGFFATPILYPEKLLLSAGLIGKIAVYFNPMSLPVKLFRSVLTGSETIVFQDLLQLFVVSIGIFLSGLFIFIKIKKLIVDLL